MKGGIFHNDEGISPVIGGVLILAISVTLLTTVQLNYVPVWNAQEELNHLEKVNDDFKELKSSIESSAVSGTVLSSPFSMGFKYSPKIVGYNPKESAYATMRINKDAWAEVRYNEMLPEGIDDATVIKNVSTSTITYSLYGTKNHSSFIYEHGLIRRSGSNYTASAQKLVVNDTLYFLSVNATSSESTSGLDRRTINVYPTSPAENSVIGRNVWLILHTKPEYADWWESNIQKEGGIIKKKDSANGTLIVFFNKNLTIRMGETQIATTSRTAPPHSPQYRLVKITPQNINLPIEGITTIEVEVQDFYNNPVPDVLVNFNANSSGTLVSNAYSRAELLQTSAISGADGRAKIQMRTHGAGMYYIDASIPEYTATFVYPASSQGGFISLYYTGSEPSYAITATLRNRFGEADNGQTISFSASEGTVSPLTDNTNAAGNASTVLDTAAATGIKITNIRTGGINRSSATITWDTINTITVTANRTPGGYIFNFVDIPANISTSGCVRYGTSPGNYSYITCDAQQRSTHNVSLSGLQAYTAYYFIVNSSRAGGGSINSSEYLFVTEPAAVDTTAPASITGLTNVTYAPLFINWTWTDPADADFAYVQVYIDGVFKSNVGSGVQSYNGSYFKPSSTHTISTRTVDTSNNVNATWVNHTAATTSILTYVYDVLATNGTVTAFSSARNGSDGGESAVFTETQVGGANMSDRTLNPGKTIAMGSQSGIYSPGSLDAVDGSIDITRPLTEKQIKTVVYYMGQRESAADLAAGTNFTTEPVNVYLPEQGVVVRTAWLELWQESGTTTAANVNTVDLFLNGVNYSIIKGGTYQTNSGESLITTATANVTPALSAFTNPTAFTAAVKTGGAASNAQALLLYITYEYDPNSPTQLRTIRYPLDTKTGLIAAGTSTAFVYNVSIPGAATIRSSWFEVRGKVDGSSTTDAVLRAKIEPNATFSTGERLDMSQRDDFGFLYLFKTTSEFSPNTQQTLTVQNSNQIVYTLGGEVVVTYEYSNAAAVQLKTVKYFVGQQTAIGGTTQLSNSTTVYIPEQNVNIRNVWAKIRATYTSATAGTQTIDGTIGAAAVASQAYTVDTNNRLIGDYMIIYNMTAAAASLVNNTVVFVNNTFNNANHGPPATELYITYDYDPSSPVELKTVEYPAGQSAVRATSWNDYFNISVPESETSRKSAYIDYATVSSATADYTTTSAIDTIFSSQTVNIDTSGEALTAGTLNGDAGNRIVASNSTYAINYSSSANAAFSGVARLTYEFRKNNSLDVTYTFTETNSSPSWQSISIQDSSYGDALANAGIFNSASSRWESVLTSAFTGGTSPATHLNAVVGASGNASNYDSGGGQIKLRYNWTGATVNNSLGVDMINVTVFYSTGGVFRLNVTTNTTSIPDASAQALQLRYNVSGDNFTLQIWNGSAWNNRTTLNDTVMSYRNITLQPAELLSDGTMAGNAATINKYYILVRYLDLNPGALQGKLYLDYQRVYSS